MQTANQKGLVWEGPGRVLGGLCKVWKGCGNGLGRVGTWKGLVWEDPERFQEGSWKGSGRVRKWYGKGPGRVQG